MYRLVIEDDEGKTTVVPIPATRDEITIGRKEGNTVRLVERNISRQHARIVRSNGSFYIEDKSSYNGVKVNGDKITGRRYIKDGDSILIGDYQLQIEQEKAEAAVAAKSEERPVPTGTAVIRVSGDREKPAKEDQDAARLCLLSGPLAGQIYTLKKNETRLGRTEDNDICLNHRSISKNHAKIVESKGVYEIVDLGSANGVRVNGEDYGKSTLRKGDRIDLGHVRLLFVAPGETFTFTAALREEVPGADASSDSGEGKKSPPMLAIAIVLLLVGGAIAAYALGLFGGATPEQATPQPNNVVTTSTPVPPSVNADDAAKLVEQAKALAAEKKWQEALELVEKAGNTELAAQYRPEADAHSNLAQCKTAFDAKQTDAAMAYCYLVATGTEAAKAGEQTISEVRAAFKKDHVDLAKKALAKKDKAGLSAARQELKKLSDYGFVTDPEVAAIRKGIDELVKSLPAETVETPTPTPTPTPNPTDDKVAKAEQVKALLEEVKKLTGIKSYDEALKKLDEAKRLDGSNAEVFRLQASIYMNKDNPDKACRAIKAYIKLVRGGGQSAILQQYMDSQDADSAPSCAN